MIIVRFLQLIDMSLIYFHTLIVIYAILNDDFNAMICRSICLDQFIISVKWNMPHVKHWVYCHLCCWFLLFISSIAIGSIFLAIICEQINITWLDYHYYTKRKVYLITYNIYTINIVFCRLFKLKYSTNHVSLDVLDST